MPKFPGMDSAAAHELTLFEDASAFLRDVLPAIEAARRRAYVEAYIVRGDSLGRKLCSCLSAAAANGADARLLYDPSGSHKLPDERLDQLRAAGVRVRPYGRLAFLGLFRPGYRNHARVVLVDDATYTGGHAWADEWLPRDQGGQGWRDLNCRARGGVVNDWARLYQRRWDEADGHRPRDFDTGDRYTDVRLISDGPGRRRPIVNAYLQAFRRARRRIWLGNAYFFPTRRFTRALFDASARGVDVAIMVPGQTDLPTIRRAARSQYAAWMDHGLRLFEYQDRMMHAKYGVVDDDWCTVGSFNAIGTAVTMTVESNLVVTSQPFVSEVAARFERDLANSRAVERRRLAERGPITRLTDLAARLMLTGANRLVGGGGTY